MNTEPITGTFHDATTGETVVRELTTDELVQYELSVADANLIEPTEP
jgi:hypothetical protein